jgi:hypothetical protein
MIMAEYGWTKEKLESRIYANGKTLDEIKERARHAIQKKDSRILVKLIRISKALLEDSKKMLPIYTGFCRIEIKKAKGADGLSGISDRIKRVEEFAEGYIKMGDDLIIKMKGEAGKLGVRY